MTTPLTGTTIAVSAAAPATNDAAGFQALSWTTVTNVLTWPQHGDTAADISIPLLSGRNLHRNGLVDGGIRNFSVAHVAGDAGQNILRNNANNQTPISVRRTEPDGQVHYYVATARDWQWNEATPTTFKGATGSLAINGGVVTVG